MNKSQEEALWDIIIQTHYTVLFSKLHVLTIHKNDNNIYAPLLDTSNFFNALPYSTSQ